MQAFVNTQARKMHRVLGATCLASLTLILSSAFAAPQLLLVNAKVFTANPQQPYAPAVAIEAGRILAAGGNDAIRALAGPGTRVIDAGGAGW